MKTILFASALAILAALGSPAAEARHDKANDRARSLISRMKAHKPKRPAIAATPLLNFSSSPRVPTQYQNLTWIVQFDNPFTNRLLSIEAKNNGVAVTGITSPFKGMFVVQLGLQSLAQNGNLEVTLYAEDANNNTDVRAAITALDTDIRRLTIQINAERDPAKRAILQEQRSEKLALKDELVTQLKKYRWKLGAQSQSYVVAADSSGATAPRITGISPVAGDQHGGTAVTVNGANFTTNVAATLGGVNVASLTYVNDSTLQIVTPDFGSNVGIKDLELRFTNGSTTSNVVFPAAFYAGAVSGTTPVNQKPVAVASGSGRIHLGDTATLDGSMSYGREGGLNYQWTVASAPQNSGFSAGFVLGSSASLPFTPDVFGTFVFQLVVTEASGTEHLSSDPSILVVQVDGAPHPLAPAIVVNPGEAGTSQVIANDPVQGESVTYTISQAPQHGTAIVNYAGLVTYAPAQGFTGSDSIGVTVTAQSGLSGTVLIPVSVVMAHQQPLPAANPISTHTEKGSTQITVTNATGGESYSYSLYLQPQHGTVTWNSSGLVQYESNPGFTGSDAFLIQVTDLSTNLSGVAPVSVTVNANSTPQVTAGSIRIAEGTSGTVQASVTDDAGQVGSYSVSTPAHGTASITASGLATYTPAAGFSGSDSFTISYTDNGSPNAVGGAVVNVTVNGAPSASAPSISVNSGRSASTQVLAMDPNGDSLSYSISMAPSHGTASVDASGLVSYTNSGPYSGADALIVRITDNGTPSLSTTVTIGITVNANQAPSLSVPGISTNVNTQAQVQASASDPDAGDTLSYSISTPPSHGTAFVDAAGLVSYTPAQDYVGSDSFEVTASDNGSPVLSASSTVAVTVNSTNHVPVASAPSISLYSGQTATSQIAASDEDAGQILSYAIQTAPSIGTAAVDANGLVSFSAPLNSSGATSLVVRVSDNGIPVKAVDVTIPVSITLNQAPVISSPLFFKLLSRGVPYQVGLSLSSSTGVSDPDGTIQSLVWDFGDGTHERITDLTGAGVNHNYMATGSYTATLTATDNRGVSSSRTISVNVVDTDIPVAKFFVSPSNGGNGTLPVTITFDASASSDTNGITQYRWLFCGQGSEVVTTSPTVQRTFTTAGTCSVRLRVRDSNVAEGSATVPVVVGSASTGVAVQAGFQVGPPREVALGTAMTFDGSRSFNPNGGTTTIGAWNWNFNDTFACPNPNGGCTASGVNANYTYNSFAINYFPSLQVVNGLGTNTSSRVNQEVFVVNAGHAPRAILRSSATSGAAPLTVNFDGNDSYDYDGSISFCQIRYEASAALETGCTNSHTYSTPGVYIASLVANDNDGNRTITSQTITVTASRAQAAKIKKAKQNRTESDPEREYQRQVLTGACGQGDAEACHNLAGMFREDGDEFTASKLEEMSCNMGFTAACEK